MTLNDQTLTTSPSPEKPVVIGGPLDGAAAIPAPAATAPAPAPVAAAPAAPKKYILHGREFESVEAALAYAEGVTSVPAPAAAAPAAPAAPTRKKPSEILFEDPEQALALLEEQITQRIDQRSNAKTAHEKAWGDFFTDHADLKGCEDVVEIVRQKLAPSFKTMTLEQAATALATETRARLAKIRGSANPSEQLPSKPATVAGASGATPPATTTTAPAKPSSLVEDLKAMQAKRGRKIS